MTVKERIKRTADKLFSLVKNNTTLTITLGIALVLFIVLMALTLGDLIARFSHEFQEVIHWDSPLYYTVGHALAEGLSPYEDMYENKPPMIFILSALSYKLFGNYRLVNITGFLMLFVILVVPVAYCIIKCVKNKTELSKSVYLCLFTLASSIAIVFFTEQFSSEAQVELLGSGFGVLSIFLASLINEEKARFYSPLIIFSGICFGITTMLKEPFALVCGMGLLLFTRNLKQLLYRVVLPVAYAVVTALIILLLGNCFVPYFTIYLKHMFSAHINLYGSPFVRMLRIDKIFVFSICFAFVLPIIYIVSMFFTGLYGVKTHYSDNVVVDKIFKYIGGLKPILFLFVTSFAVGLGGQYYNHHFVFATPFFVSTLMIMVKYLAEQKTTFFAKTYKQEKESLSVATETNTSAQESSKFRKNFLKSVAIYRLIILFMVVSFVSFLFIPRYLINDFEKNEAIVPEYRNKAEYVDDILDTLAQENYLWIGFNGYARNPCPYTRHLPLGPSFVQDEYNFQTEDTFLTMEFKKQLEKTNVIVTKHTHNFELGALATQTEEYIYKNFTMDMPKAVVDANLTVPDDFEFYIFYRITAFEFSVNS